MGSPTVLIVKRKRILLDTPKSMVVVQRLAGGWFETSPLLDDVVAIPYQAVGENAYTPREDSGAAKPELPSCVRHGYRKVRQGTSEQQLGHICLHRSVGTRTLGQGTCDEKSRRNDVELWLYETLGVRRHFGG